MNRCKLLVEVVIWYAPGADGEGGKIAQKRYLCWVLNC
jgi:hypothetical protein